MKILLLILIFIVVIGIADATYMNDSVIGLDNSAYITIMTTNFTNFTKYGALDNPPSTIEFYINGSRIRYTSGTNKTISSPVLNNVTDNFTIDVSGTAGYLNFSVAMQNASNSYNLTSNGVFVESKNSDINKIVWYNYTGAYPTTLTVTWNASQILLPLPNITSWSNNITNSEILSFDLNINNAVLFNATANQTITNWTWTGATQISGNGTMDSNASHLFNTLGLNIVTVKGTNSNGTSSMITWNINVVSGGGAGTDWDYAYGWINYSNATMVNGATVTTSQGIQTTDINGYYTFGYVFVHGNTYDFNITKNGIWDNKSITFNSGDFKIVNGTLLIPVNATPNITSWSNNITNNDSLSFTVNKFTNVSFNATSNQTITSCNWIGATQINCSGTDTNSYRNFTSAGVNIVSITVSNANGTSNTITWTITVNGTTGLKLEGYVNNTLELYVKDARIDFNGNHTFTNVSGYYLFTDVTEGNYTVLARAIGYSNQTKNISITNNTVLNFTLQERLLPAVKVSPESEPLGILGALLGILILLFIIKRNKT